MQYANKEGGYNSVKHFKSVLKRVGKRGNSLPRRTGSFGTVYRVLRTADAKELAVKVLDHSGSESDRTANECARWEASSSPYHPSILPLLEVLFFLGNVKLDSLTAALPLTLPTGVGNLSVLR